MWKNKENVNNINLFVLFRTKNKKWKAIGHGRNDLSLSKKKTF